MACEVLNGDDASRRGEVVRRAGEVLREGGVVVFPTETVYGVGAAAVHAGAVARLRAVKDRADDKPFTVHVPTPASVGMYVDLEGDAVLRKLVRKTMPGPVTVVAHVSDEVIERSIRAIEDGLGSWGQPSPPPQRRDLSQGERGLRGRLYHGNTIALRCPDHALGSEILRAAGLPVVASSANRAGEVAPTDARGALRALGESVDLVVDGGVCRYSEASTIVEVRGGRATILREGLLDRRRLDALLKTTLLFICTGNTCRSAMAESIAREEIGRRLGVSAGEVERAGFEVMSAGVYAVNGARMTGEAAEALRSLGIEPHGHSSRALTAQMLRSADAAWGMTRAHVRGAEGLGAGSGVVVGLLDGGGGELEDPIGGGREVYLQCANRLRELIRTRLDELGVGTGG